MSDPPSPKKSSKDPHRLPDDPELAEGHLRSWLRDSERVGVLRESKAEIDLAFARGYAQGLEQAREEDLDALRTILLRWLEARFGEVQDTTMDKIESATWPILERWMLAVHSASTEEEALK